MHSCFISLTGVLYVHTQPCTCFSVPAWLYLLHLTPLAAHTQPHHAHSALEEEQEIFPIKYWWSENEQRLSGQTREPHTHTHTRNPSNKRNAIKTGAVPPIQARQKSTKTLCFSVYLYMSVSPSFSLSSVFLSCSLSFCAFLHLSISSVWVSLARSALALFSAQLSLSQQQGDGGELFITHNTMNRQRNANPHTFMRTKEGQQQTNRPDLSVNPALL